MALLALYGTIALRNDGAFYAAAPAKIEEILSFFLQLFGGDL